MMARNLFTVVCLACATTSLSLPSAARAEDRIAGYKYVTETPQPGEKSRTTSYNPGGRKTGVKIVFTSGITRNESYRPADGTLRSVHETDFHGFSHDTEYGADGKTITSETYHRDNAKESQYDYNADGSFRVTWYGFANGNKQAVDEISKTGDVVRTHYQFDGRPSGVVHKGKREVLKNGVAKTTWFNDKGTAEKIEYLNVDRTLTTERLEADGVTVRWNATIDRPWHSSKVTYLAQAMFNKGKMTSSRAVRLDKGLDLLVYQADGKTLKVKQSWKYDRRTPGQGRTTDWLLESIEEFDNNGKLVRKLVFDNNGRKVREVHLYNAGTLTTKRYLRDDGSRVTGTVEKDETFDATGKVVKTDNHPASAAVRESIDGTLLLDPVYRNDEPGKIVVNIRV